MATYHITDGMNAMLIAMLAGPKQFGTPEVGTLLDAKLITTDKYGWCSLTPAGRRWALIKRDQHPDSSARKLLSPEV